MWLCDLEKAVQELKDLCPNYVFTKVVPAGYGIAFYTTHFSKVVWCNDGQIIEHYDIGEIKILKNFS